MKTKTKIIAAISLFGTIGATLPIISLAECSKKPSHAAEYRFSLDYGVNSLVLDKVYQNQDWPVRLDVRNSDGTPVKDENEWTYDAIFTADPGNILTFASEKLTYNANITTSLSPTLNFSFDITPKQKVGNLPYKVFPTFKSTGCVDTQGAAQLSHSEDGLDWPGCNSSNSAKLTFTLTSDAGINDGNYFYTLTGVSTYNSYALYSANNLVIPGAMHHNSSDTPISGGSSIPTGDYPLLYIGSSSITGVLSTGKASLTGLLKITNGVTTICDSAFSSQIGLTRSLTLPDTLITIGASAFSGCNNIGSDHSSAGLTLPSGLVNVGNSAFSGCSYINNITFHNVDHNSTFFPLWVGTSIFSAWKTSGGTVSSQINGETFPWPQACSYLKRKYGLPLAWTPKLSGYNLDGHNWSGVIGGTSAILSSGYSINTSINVDPYAGTYSINNTAGNVFAANNLVIPDVVTDGDFEYLVTNISTGAFFADASTNSSKAILSGSLTIGNNVTSIGDNAFEMCTGLSGSLTLGSSLTTIGFNAFNNCGGLTGALSLPSSVTSLGVACFGLCSGFTSINLGNTISSIPMSSFEGCSGLKGDLIIPDTVTSIGGDAFKNCSSLDGTLKIPSNTTSIGTDAFKGLTKVHDLNLSNFSSIATWKDTDNKKIFEDLGSYYPASSLYVNFTNFSGSTTDVTISAFFNSLQTNDGLGSAWVLGGDCELSGQNLNILNTCSSQLSLLSATITDPNPDHTYSITSVSISDNLNSSLSIVNNNNTYSVKLDLTGTDSAKINLRKSLKETGVSYNYELSITAKEQNTNLTLTFVEKGTISCDSSTVWAGNADGTDWPGYISGKISTKSLSSSTDYEIYNAANLISKDLIIPDKIVVDKGATQRPLKEIDESSFAESPYMQGSVRLPNSLTSVERSAFYGCYNITGLSLPMASTVKYGNWAFYYCEDVSSITFRNWNSITADQFGTDVFTKVGQSISSGKTLYCVSCSATADNMMSALQTTGLSGFNWNPTY